MKRVALVRDLRLCRLFVSEEFSLRTLFVCCCLILVACSDSSTSVVAADGSLGGDDMRCGTYNSCGDMDTSVDQGHDSRLRDSDIADSQAADHQLPDAEMPPPVDASSGSDSEVELDSERPTDSAVDYDSVPTDAEAYDVGTSDAETVDSALADMGMTSLDADLPIADSAINPSDAASGADSEVDWGEGTPDAGSMFPDTCSNGQRESAEEEVDCGGPCPPCLEFESCENSDECDGQAAQVLPSYCEWYPKLR